MKTSTQDIKLKPKYTVKDLSNDDYMGRYIHWMYECTECMAPITIQYKTKPYGLKIRCTDCGQQFKVIKESRK